MPCFRYLLLPLFLYFCTGPIVTAQANASELPQEKIFAHLDKSVYRAGEPLFVALYLVNATSHAPDSISGVIHLELRGPEDKIVLAHKIYPNNGHAAGDFLLPVDLLPGHYQVVAYTRHQLNHGTQMIYRSPITVIGGLPEAGGKTVPAPVPPSRRAARKAVAEETPRPAVRLGFFPEGGDCVVGLPCRVVIVAENEEGHPLSLEGYVGEPGQVPAGFFKTNARGTGSLHYSPSSTASLTVNLKNKEGIRFELPPAKESGANISVINEVDSVRIRLRSNLLEGLQGHTIRVQARSVDLFRYDLRTTGTSLDFLLRKDKLVPGVYTATVYDPQGEPIAERLFFSAPREAGTIRIETARQTYPTRTSIDIECVLPESAEQAEGRLSISVIPSAVAALSDADIRTWLLVNSDLDRPIPDLDEMLLTGKDRKQEAIMDEIMLTRAWRRFRRQPSQEHSAADESYALEPGLFISGRMTKLSRPDAGRPGKVWLTRIETGLQLTTLTDPEGYFQFGPFAVFDTIPVLLQGRFRSGKRPLSDKISLTDKRDVDLLIIDPVPPRLPALPQPQPAASNGEEVEQYNENDRLIAEYAEISRRALTVARQYDSLIIDLDVVEVATKRLDPAEIRRDKRANLYGTPDDRIIVDELSGAFAARTVLDLLRNVAGVRVTDNGAFGGSVQIRGGGNSLSSSEPLFVIDGFPADLEWALNIPPQQIEFIDILKGASAAAFGVRGGNGVILIYTREGGFESAPINGTKPTKLYGYHTHRQFSDFFASAKDTSRPDIRTTLHWNPFLYYDATGQAQETFLSSDQTGSYTVIVQGLGNDGSPYYGRTTFTVE